MKAIAIAIAIGTATLAAPAPTPASVDASIREKGAKRTIDDLVRTGRWEAVADAMDRGDTAWIMLAPRLAPGSDAGTAEDLGLSLAFALPRNPRAVLAALDPGDGVVLGAGRICGRPFIEDTEPAGYVATTETALSRVTDPRLGRRKAMCLRALPATLRRHVHG